MITINLLPTELRPLEKTPPARFITIITGTALSVSALFILLILQFRTLPAETLKRDNAKKELADKKAKVLEYNRLKEEIDFFNLRVNTVKQIRQERTIWSKKLFLFHKVIHETPTVTIRSLSISTKAGRGRSAGPPQSVMKVDCYSTVGDIRAAADFMRKLKKSEFYKDCESVKSGDVRVTQGTAGGATCEFGLTIVFKPQYTPPPPPLRKKVVPKKK